MRTRWGAAALMMLAAIPPRGSLEQRVKAGYSLDDYLSGGGRLAPAFRRVQSDHSIAKTVVDNLGKDLLGIQANPDYTESAKRRLFAQAFDAATTAFATANRGVDSEVNAARKRLEELRAVSYPDTIAGSTQLLVREQQLARYLGTLRAREAARGLVAADLRQMMDTAEANRDRTQLDALCEVLPELQAARSHNPSDARSRQDLADLAELEEDLRAAQDRIRTPEQRDTEEGEYFLQQLVFDTDRERARATLQMAGYAAQETFYVAGTGRNANPIAIYGSIMRSSDERVRRFTTYIPVGGGEPVLVPNPTSWNQAYRDLDERRANRASFPSAGPDRGALGSDSTWRARMGWK